MHEYPVCSVQIIDNTVEQMHKSNILSVKIYFYSFTYDINLYSAYGIIFVS